MDLRPSRAQHWMDASQSTARAREWTMNGMIRSPAPAVGCSARPAARADAQPHHLVRRRLQLQGRRHRSRNAAVLRRRKAAHPLPRPPAGGPCAQRGVRPPRPQLVQGALHPEFRGHRHEQLLVPGRCPHGARPARDRCQPILLSSLPEPPRLSRTYPYKGSESAGPPSWQRVPSLAPLSLHKGDECLHARLPRAQPGRGAGRLGKKFEVRARRREKEERTAPQPPPPAFGTAAAAWWF